MTEVTLHPTPRERDVVREQVRVVGLGLRREALVLAIVLGIVTLPIAVDILRGSAATWFDSDDWIPIGIVSFFVPFAVWRRERLFRPAFLWTLPVDRRRLALARVFAGWVCLMAPLAAFVLWQLVLAVLSGVTGAQIVSSIAFPAVDRRQLDDYRERYELLSTRLFAGRTVIHILSDGDPGNGFTSIDAGLEDVYFSSLMQARRAA